MAPVVSGSVYRRYPSAPETSQDPKDLESDPDNVRPPGLLVEGYTRGRDSGVTKVRESSRTFVYWVREGNLGRFLGKGRKLRTSPRSSRGNNNP